MDDRTPNGQFRPGWRGGPGRPKRSTEESYRAALLTAVPVQTWSKILAVQVKSALKGNLKAAEWLGKLLVGSEAIEAASLVEQLQDTLTRVRSYEQQLQAQGGRSDADGGSDPAAAHADEGRDLGDGSG